MTFTTRGAPVGPRQQRPAGRPAGRSSMITASTTTRRSRARAPWSTFPAYKKRSTRTMRRRLPLRRSKFLLAASTAVRVAMVPTCTTSTLEVLSPGPRLVGAVNVEKINAQQQSQQQGNAGNGSGTTTNTAQTAQPSSKTNEGNCNGGGSCGQNTSGEELQRMKDGTPKAVIGQFSDPHKGPDVVPDPAEQPPRGPSSASRLQASQRVPSSEGAGTGTSTAAAAGGHQDPDQPRNPTDLAAAASLSTKRTTSKTGGSPPGVDEASTRTSGNEITPGDPLKAAAAGEHQSAGEPPPRCETLTDGQAEGVLCVASTHALVGRLPGRDHGGKIKQACLIISIRCPTSGLARRTAISGWSPCGLKIANRGSGGIFLRFRTTRPNNP
ncbi:unnamed protein product [Amoebophrya sp. A120]|nr:unnamed protein product [Amoebophrya sp. A120]|eukprot:GSA120T00009742001.1